MNKENMISEKKDRIIKAAVKVFSSKGFHEARVEEIAQLADVGKGTVYEYFSSKADLFQEMFKAGMEFYHKSITEQLVSSSTAAQKLKQIAQLHLNFIIEYSELAKITMSEHAHFDQDFRQWLFEMREQKLMVIEKIVVEGINSGEFRKEVSPRAASLAFSGIIGSLFGPAVIDGQGNSGQLNEILDQIFELLLKGIISNSS